MNSEQGIIVAEYEDRLRKVKLSKITQTVILEWSSWIQTQVWIPNPKV